MPPGVFTLELDTAAPQLTFGTQNAAALGSVFEIAYTINEPGILTAELYDALGSTHELTVHPDKLALLITESVSLGPATLRIITRDDVMNQQEFQVGVNIGALLHLTYTDRARPVISIADASEDQIVSTDSEEIILTLTDRAGRIISLTDQARPKLSASDSLS